MTKEADFRCVPQFFCSHFDSIAPTSAPANISGYAVDSTSISISWSPPPFEDQNGILRHYVINITELETGITFSRVSLTTSISLHNLHPFYRYSVTVTAVTVGPGPATIVFIVQTREDGGFLFDLDHVNNFFSSFKVEYMVLFFRWESFSNCSTHWNWCG